MAYSYSGTTLVGDVPMFQTEVAVPPAAQVTKQKARSKGNCFRMVWLQGERHLARVETSSGFRCPVLGLPTPPVI